MINGYPYVDPDIVCWLQLAAAFAGGWFTRWVLR